MEDPEVVQVEVRRSASNARSARVLSALLLAVAVGVPLWWRSQHPLEPAGFYLNPPVILAIVAPMAMIALLIGAYELLARGIAWCLDRLPWGVRV